jgi:hypothetical protein
MAANPSHSAGGAAVLAASPWGGYGGRSPNGHMSKSPLAKPWAFAALTASPGARAHYDRRRDRGDRHAAAQRNLFNRLLGCLHHCLATRQHYNEATAFPNSSKKLPNAA